MDCNRSRRRSTPRSEEPAGEDGMSEAYAGSGRKAMQGSIFFIATNPAHR